MKFCIFLACAASLIFAGLCTPAAFHLENITDGTFSIYSAEFVESPLFSDTIDLGYSYIYECAAADATAARKLFRKIDGESLATDKTVGLRDLGAKFVAADKCADTQITYAYNPKIPTFIRQGGRKINLQIARTKSGTIVGWPVILGSY